VLPLIPARCQVVSLGQQKISPRLSIYPRFARRTYERTNRCVVYRMASNGPGKEKTMRFMIMVRANALSESAEPFVDEAIFAEMARYHEELAKAGVLLDASGLQPSARGFRVRYTDGKPSIVDGPFAETKELIAGYTLIQVRSRDEALEWARRFPSPFGKRAESEIEVRQLYELEDFPDSAGMESFRKLQEQRKAS
jgi:hypothetical protein